MSHADRVKFEDVILEALAMLRDAIEASITSPDPHSALEKIVEQCRVRNLRQFVTRGIGEQGSNSSSTEKVFSA